MKINKEGIHKIVEKVVREELRKVDNNYTKVSDVIDIDKIPFSQLQQIDIDLRDILYGFRFDGDISYDGEKLVINESAENKTVSPNQVKRELMGKFITFGWQFVVNNTDNGVKIILIYADEGVNGEILCKKMKNMGWFKSYELKPMIRKGITVRSMSFDPMFQKPIDDPKKRWKYLYHLSPKYNEESILKSGLLPSTKNKFFNYPNRIYMLTPNVPIGEIEKLAHNLNLFEKDKDNKDLFTLYRIDTSRLSDDIKLYYDPRSKYGVFSEQPIPRAAITGTKDIEANE